MAKKWADVAGSPDYLGLSSEEQAQVRRGYFDGVLAPNIPETEHDAAWQDFEARSGKRSATRSPLAPPEESAGGGSSIAAIARDIGTGLEAGGVMAAQDINEIGRKARGPLAVGPKLLAAGIDALSARRGLPTGEGGANALKSISDRVQDQYSPEFKQAGAKKWWDSEAQSFGPAWSDPRSYAKGLLESLPENVLTMAPTMQLAKGAFMSTITKLLGQGVARDEAEKLAAKAAARTAYVAGGAIEGGLAGAQSSREVRDDIMGMSDETLLKSDAIKSLMQQGMSLGDAKKHIAESGASRAFLMAGVTTGMFGGMGDRALAHAMFGGDKSLVKKFVKGAVGEGLLEEFPQSYLQQVSQNIATLQADPSRNITEDALNQGLGGLAIGGVQGGVQNVAFGRTPKEAQAARAPEPVSAARCSARSRRRVPACATRPSAA
jgi:hypothetical protein